MGGGEAQSGKKLIPNIIDILKVVDVYTFWGECYSEMRQCMFCTLI